MNNNKKRISRLISLVLLVFIFLLATYAYLPILQDEGKTFDTNVTTTTTDSLIFKVSNDVSMSISPQNFNTGMGNQEKEITAIAELKANNKTNNTTEHYYVYFDIKENELSYSVDETKPELLLQIIDPKGKTWNQSDYDKLDYKTVTDGLGESISGFDITEVNSLITIANEYEITTTSTKEGCMAL